MTRALTVALLLLCIIGIAAGEPMITRQEAQQPFRHLWYTRVGVPAADSLRIYFPRVLAGVDTTTYDGWNFNDAHGVLLRTTAEVDIKLFSDVPGVYSGYQRIPANTWFPYPDLGIDSLKARHVSGVCTLSVWTFLRR